jgi:hypothetical protein
MPGLHLAFCSAARAHSGSAYLSQSRLGQPGCREGRDLRAAEAELASRSLGEFIRQAWPVVEPGTAFVDSWYVDVIAEYLTAADRGEIRRLVVNIPPRHGKSLLVSVFWPAWAWTSRPERRFLYASYAQSLSTRDSVRCRRLIESSWFRERWGDTPRDIRRWVGDGRGGRCARLR